MVERSDLEGLPMREVAHGHGKGMFFYTYGVEGHPRLTRNDRYLRKDRSVVSTWRVDGKDCADLEAAITALNIPAVFTPEELATMAALPESWDVHDKCIDFATAYGLRQKGGIEITDRTCRLSDTARQALADTSAKEAGNG